MCKFWEKETSAWWFYFQANLGGRVSDPQNLDVYQQLLTCDILHRNNKRFLPSFFLILKRDHFDSSIMLILARMVQVYILRSLKYCRLLSTKTLLIFFSHRTLLVAAPKRTLQPHLLLYPCSFPTSTRFSKFSWQPCLFSWLRLLKSSTN